jgi:hypothetical protein
MRRPAKEAALDLAGQAAFGARKPARFLLQEAAPEVE